MAYVLPGESSTARAPWLVGAVLLAGAAVAVFLGVYADLHTPTGEATPHLWFPTMLSFKAWLTTLAVAFGVFQLLSSLRLRDRLRWPRTIPTWLPDAHRLSGSLVLLCSLPVAYHCLWSLGFAFDASPFSNGRVLLHAVAGCVFYGAIVTKTLTVEIEAVPRWLIPWAGGVVFASLTVVWLTSSLYYFTGRL